MKKTLLLALSVSTMWTTAGCRPQESETDTKGSADAAQAVAEQRPSRLREWIDACQAIPKQKLEEIFQIKLLAGESMQGSKHYCEWKQDGAEDVIPFSVSSVFHRYNTAAENWKGREAEEGYELLSNLGDYAILKRAKSKYHYQLIILADKGTGYVMTSFSGPPPADETDVETSLKRLREFTTVALERM